MPAIPTLDFAIFSYFFVAPQAEEIMAKFKLLIADKLTFKCIDNCVESTVKR